MTGVFLIGFGQPQSLDEVGDFIERVTGRTPPERAVRAARDRYERIGGKSPLLDITLNQAAALEKILEEDGVSARVYAAMRHSPPVIVKVVSKALNDGVNKAVVITLAPQYADISAGTYLRLFDEACKESRLRRDSTFEVKKIRSYGIHPLFLDAVAENLRRGAARCAPTTPVIFSAHSLPIKSAFELTTYLGELDAGVRGVAERLGLEKTRLAFQSKGGGRFDWLGPSIEEVMEELAKAGETAVAVSPLGFVSDHVETLYDLDIAAKEKAESLGLEFVRAPSLNDSPGFIKLLATLVKENIG